VAAAGSASDISPWLLVLAGVLLAGGVHAAKATTRPAVNITTAGMGAPIVSAAEDVGAVIMSAVAIAAPILVAVFAAGLVYSFWRLWQRKKKTGSIVAEP
jgi:hypothetical protein